MNKKLVLSVLSTAVLTSMAASAMAKPSQGFYVGGEVDKYYSPTALLADFKAGLKEILSNATDTVYVNKDGKAANFLVAAEAEKMEDVLKPATRDLFEENDYAVVGSEGEKWNPADEDDWPVPGDITVESVSAITTVVNNENGQLEFAVNNETSAADLEKVKEAGYEVQFLASANVFTGVKNTSADGKLVNLQDGQKFAYQVVVTKDGQEVAKSEKVEVTAKALANVVTSVESVALYVVQNGKEVKVTSGKLAAGDVAKVKVVGKTADMKADAKGVDITSKVQLASNKLAVATVAEDGTVTAGSAKGDATITVKAGNIEQSLNINAGNAARTVDATKSTITTKSLELATGATGKIEVSLKDQYGDTYVPAADTVVTEKLTVDGKDLAAAVTKSSVTDDLTVKLDLVAGENAGTGKVVVKAGNTKLGEVNLTVKAPGEIVTYKLETTKKEYVLDLKDSTEFELKLNGYDKEGLLKQAEISLDGYTLESSNKDVATVDENGKVTAHSVGTAVITIYKTEDAFKTPVATQTVTVKDTTPAITKITFKEVATLTSTEAVAFDSIIATIATVDSEGKTAAATVATNGDVKVDAVKIGKVVVTAVPAKGSEFTASISEEGKLEVIGTGKGVINVAVLNNQDYVVSDLNINVDIAATEEPQV